MELCKLVLKSKVVEPPIEEIDSYTHLGVAKYVHNILVKPISYLGSSRILQNMILDKVSSGKAHETILDVACGDDEVVISLANLARLVVANDISRQTMLSLIKKSKSENIIFTNQNLLELNFKSKFDVVICKNVMHHMRNAVEIEVMLNVLKKLGKRIIIMDVENPKLHLLSKLWNNYYIRFLDDQGGSFISFDQFKIDWRVSRTSASKIDTSNANSFPSNKPLSLNFKSGITSRARKDKVI